jgi:hypothetical protein
MQRHLILKWAFQASLPPDSSPEGLPIYTEALASSGSSSPSSTPQRLFDPHVLSYFDVSALEADRESIQ